MQVDHQTNNKVMSIISNVARMLLQLLVTHSSVTPPVGDPRLWKLAFGIVGGWIDAVNMPSFRETDKEKIVSEDLKVFDEPRYSWKEWRDLLVSLYYLHFHENLKQLKEQFDFVKVTQLPLNEHAEECATNLSTKLRYQTAPLLIKLLKFELSFLRKEFQCIGRKGVFGKVLAEMKKCLALGLTSFEWSNIGSVTEEDVVEIKKDLGLTEEMEIDDFEKDNMEVDNSDEMELDEAIVVNPDFAASADKISGILNSIKQEQLFALQSSRLLQVDDFIPPLRPAFRHEIYADMKIRELPAKHRKKGNLDKIRKTWTKEKFETLPVAQQNTCGTAAAIHHDFLLWSTITALKKLNQNFTSPKYHYYTLQHQASFTKDGRPLTFYPSYVTDQDDKPLVEPADQYFDFDTANDEVAVAIIDSVEKGDKTFGITPTMLYKVYSSINERMEQLNDTLPDLSKADYDVHDPFQVQQHINDSQLKRNSKKERQAVARSEKDARFRKMGKPIEHVKKPVYLRNSHINDMDLDEDLNLMEIDVIPKILPTPVVKDSKNVAEKPLKKVSLPVPLLEPSFTPKYFYFDWDATQEFYQNYFNIRLAHTRDFSRIFEVYNKPYLKTGRGRKRNSLSGPLREGPDTTTIILGFMTDGFGITFKVSKYSLAKSYASSSPLVHLDNETDREYIQGLIAQGTHMIGSSDPGRRDVEKQIFLIPLHFVYSS